MKRRQAIYGIVVQQVQNVLVVVVAYDLMVGNGICMTNHGIDE